MLTLLPPHRRASYRKWLCFSAASPPNADNPTTISSSEPGSGTVVGVEIETSERNAVLEIFDGFVTGFWYKGAESEAY